MELVLGIDQGTQSTKCIFYNLKLEEVVKSSPRPLHLICEHPGWVEEDASAIMESVYAAVSDGVAVLKAQGIAFTVKAVGVTNQRETIVVWDRKTSQPLHNALVWMDQRTSKIVAQISSRPAEELRELHSQTGLWPHNYFSAFKLVWLMQNVKGLREKLWNGEAIVGTIDSWIVWNLTGGVAHPEAAIHATDITNASRTFLFDIRTLSWGDSLLKIFDVPSKCLATVGQSCSIFGAIHPSVPVPPELHGVAISACMGDQQASLLGHGLFKNGLAKCTFGTGAFFLQNIGVVPRYSQHLLTTVCASTGTSPTAYAFEGAIADVGSLVSWLKNSLGLIQQPEDTSRILDDTSDSNGVIFIPSFSGIYAPHWRDDSKGTIFGLTQTTTKEEIVRAALESIGFRLLQIIIAAQGKVKAVTKTDRVQLVDDEGEVKITRLRVDGGMSVNSQFMQLIADITGIPVECSATAEQTARGAAVGAALGCGMLANFDEILDSDTFADKIWHPRLWPERASKFIKYQEATSKSLTGQYEELDIFHLQT